MLLALAPMFPIMGVNAVWRNIAPAMTPLAALLLVPYPRPSVYSLAVGSTIGLLAEMLILGTCLLKLRRYFPVFGQP